MMREDWVMTELGNTCVIISGKNQKQVEDLNGKYPIYGSGGVFGYADKYLCEAGTTIIGRKGTINSPIYVNEKFWNVDTAFGISPSVKTNSKYVYYFCVGFNFKKLDKSTTIPSLAKRDIINIIIPLAPLPEQRAIVAKIEQLLSDLDNGISNLKTAKGKLEIYRQAMLKKAFEGELTKEWRDSNFQKIEDWQKKLLADVSDKITDGEHFRPKTQESGIYFLSAKDIRENGVDFSSPLYISEETANKALKRCNPERNDILIVSRGATVGRMCIVNTDKVFCLLGSVILIKVNESVNSRYLTYVLKSPILKQNLITLSGSTAQQAIYLRDIKKVEIPIPTFDEQAQIVQEIETRLSVCDKLSESIDQSLEKSEALRQSILKKAFEGKLLSESELEACRQEHDWEPADKLLERIKKEKVKSSNITV